MSRHHPARVARYWARLIAGGCLIDGGPAEIAHCHGGSIVERMQEPKARGMKLGRCDWLVLPLCPPHHRHPPTRLIRGLAIVTGDVSASWEALDDSVDAWERRYGPQSAFIDLLADRHGLALWALAKEGAK